MGSFPETYNDPKTFIVTVGEEGGVLPLRGGFTREGYLFQASGI